MNIKHYILSTSNKEVTTAVDDVMTLFKVTAIEPGHPANIYDNVSPECVLVEVGITYGDQDKDTVKISIYYHKSIADNSMALRRTDPAGSPVLSSNTFNISPNIYCHSAELSAKTASNEGTVDNISIIKRLTKRGVLEFMRNITGINPSPWGILRGVRPTKIVHRLLDQGFGSKDIIDILTGDYALHLNKAKLVTGIARHQRQYLSVENVHDLGKAVSLYISVPFCPTRCLYCSFPAHTLPKDKEQLAAYMRAVRTDINAAAKLISKFGLSVETVYIGGGTPTSLPADDLAALLTMTKEAYTSANTIEFTVEAGRPDSLDDAKIATLRDYGVTRVSINPQTMQEKTLQHLGRRHTVQDIIDTFEKIRRTQIPVINMDVIAGLPGESETDMENTMHQLSRLGPENITVHTLAIKRGSLLKSSLSSMSSMSEKVQVDLPDEETTNNMLAIAADYTAKMNMHPYYLYRQKYMTGNLENVGYAKKGNDCLYNIRIMEERQTIIGIGPAAGTKAVNTVNWRLQSCYNPKDVNTYINNLNIYLQERNTLLTRLFGDLKGE
ncbi:MAG TPA: coproporphyrinogen dehydrogenase HemZ [Methylomusa anaerophila]|uniref:Oxygen-independent coproporphyrinogen-III oxidase 2 n=1 Tax=Methylomusa anaerophila TaxID=1930071 RepID=A0A348AP82_9FIRM|nr:coproporphyrinogen dehydrogenase HemZ [Methylomusa anaerophila]BBB92880.1 oxygen-independent coproporphyrinogen-III oxidase 2 [Methylomusa anaerophila]HML87284.1 coproporphyrinogen dehydrogenase HemZ [Methylomusa anaerophila]